MCVLLADHRRIGRWRARRVRKAGCRRGSSGASAGPGCCLARAYVAVSLWASLVRCLDRCRSACRGVRTRVPLVMQLSWKLELARFRTARKAVCMVHPRTWFLAAGLTA